MNKPEPRVALVTGVSRANGIGAAICRELARRGTSIYFTHWLPFDEGNHYASSGGPDAIALALASSGVPVAHGAFDLRCDGVWDEVLDATEAAHGTPSILVNNAAHWASSNYRDLTAATIDQHAAVNVRATMMLSVSFVRRIERHGWGRIVNLVSGNDLAGEPDNLAYGATKGAVSAFTRYLATEVVAKGITVNAVDPGPTDTGWMDSDTKDAVLARSPMGRLGTPNDAARLVAFLTSDEASWITGQILHSDGGFRT